MTGEIRQMISWQKCRKLLAAMVALTTTAHAEYALDIKRPVTDVGKTVLDLHHLIFWICVGIAVLVFGVMFYSILRHRKSLGVTPAKFSHSTTVEVIWTLIPTLILFVMAIPSTKALIEMGDTTESDMTVKITGYQWFWKYEYLDSGVSFFSRMDTPWSEIRGETAKEDDYLLDVDNELVLPVGKKVKFLITSDDVIHSWWVQEIAVKKDAIPGILNEAWAQINEPGVYRGVCAELCGKDHGFMPIVVRAVDEAEYASWVSEQQSASAN